MDNFRFKFLSRKNSTSRIYRCCRRINIKQQIFEIITDWQIEASQAVDGERDSAEFEACAELFSTFISSGMSSPVKLADAIKDRNNALTQGKTNAPVFFPEELDYNNRLINVLDLFIMDEERLQKLVETTGRLIQDNKVIIFCDNQNPFSTVFSLQYHLHNTPSPLLLNLYV